MGRSSGTGVWALTVIAVLVSAPPARAAGVVTDCQNFGTVGTVGTLADAINGGGVVTFNCSSGSGTIIVPQMSVTSGSLTVDASASATPITLDGNNANRHFFVTGNASLTLRRLTLQNGRVNGADVFGGSISSLNAGITIDGCVFRNNTLTGSGNVRGGAIAILTGALPRTIENSTFEGNSVSSPGVPAGGALFTSTTAGSIVVRNSTFHGNSVNGTSGNGHGGAIAFDAGGGFAHQVTVTGNAVNGTASSVGGGGIYVDDNATQVSNSIVAGNTSTGSGQDVRTLTSGAFPGTYNLIGNGDTSGFTFGPTNLVGTTASPLDPLLAPLGPFGGPTPTRLPLPASAANNAIPTANCPLLTDQRGAARTGGQPCTMGAVEPDWALTATGGTPQSTLVNTAFPAPLAVELADQLDQHLAGIQVDFAAPPSGASATLGAPSANTDALGAAQVTATANGTAGSYQVNATTTGVTPAAAFDLTNSPPTADLAINKTDGVATATPGQSVTYTITASNSGPQPVTGGTVTDTFPAILACTWTCVGAGGGTCTAAGSGNIGDTVNLPVGASATYTATCTINSSATGSLSNTAGVSSSVSHPTPGNTSATDTDTLTPQADLAITKTDGVTTATPGSSVTYTITASNSGPSNAPGATVADTFPASLTCTWTCAGAGGGTCTAAGSGNINDTVNLPPSGSVTYTASCTISAAATGSLSNTATVAAPAGVTDPNPGNNSATDTDTLGAQADLAITKTDGVTTATPGGAVTYTITASNSGPSNTTGATVTDTFPASLTCTWTCVGAGGATCTAAGSGNIGDTVNLPAGGSATYTASWTISLAATGTLSNMATVSAPGGVTDPDPANNSATDTDTLGAAPAASVSGTKTVSGSASPGGTITYSVTLTNGGSGAQGDNPGDEFTDVLPPQLALVSATATSGTAVANVGTNTVTWNGSIPAAGSVTITITATILPATEGQTVSNQGAIAFDSDGNGTNEATAPTDDPGAPGGANATSFVVGGLGVPAIPTLPGGGLLLLALTLAVAALAVLRRRPVG